MARLKETEPDLQHKERYVAGFVHDGNVVKGNDGIGSDWQQKIGRQPKKIQRLPSGDRHGHTFLDSEITLAPFFFVSLDIFGISAAFYLDCDIISYDYSLFAVVLSPEREPAVVLFYPDSFLLLSYIYKYNL
jgi:hypothetical protein